MIRSFRIKSSAVPVYAALMVITAVQVLPFVWAVTTSIKPLEEAYVLPPTLLGSETKWSNYADAFEKLPCARFLFNSMVISPSDKKRSVYVVRIEDLSEALNSLNRRNIALEHVFDF